MVRHADYRGCRFAVCVNDHAVVRIFVNCRKQRYSFVGELDCSRFVSGQYGGLYLGAVVLDDIVSQTRVEITCDIDPIEQHYW